MTVIDQWCFSCSAMHPHERGDDCVVCTGCGAVTSTPEDLLELAFSPAPVIDMRFCRWCNATKPADHDCPAGAVGCTSRAPDETPCGACLACIAAMTADLGRAEFEHGSPSDLRLLEESP